MQDILCTYCGRWKSSAEAKGVTHCHPMFGGREHLFDGNHPAHGPDGGAPLSDEVRAELTKGDERRRLAALAVQQYAMECGAGELWLGDEPLDKVHGDAAEIVRIVEGVLAGKRYVRVGDDENWEWVLTD